MRLLIDANLSPRVAVALGKAGLESVHVFDVGLPCPAPRSPLALAAFGSLDKFSIGAGGDGLRLSNLDLEAARS